MVEDLNSDPAIPVGTPCLGSAQLSLSSLIKEIPRESGGDQLR